MSVNKTCKQCGLHFYGRANQIYCGTSCKNQANNAIDLKMRRDNRYFAKVLEKNERVLRHYMQHRAVNQNLIAKHELAKQGFNLYGPFVVHDGKYLVGNYFLKDMGWWFQVSLIGAFTELGLIERLFPLPKKQ